jgi:hypothetical protein
MLPLGKFARRITLILTPAVLSRKMRQAHHPKGENS